MVPPAALVHSYHVQVNGLPTEVLVLPAARAPASRHLVFFPGDVQMRRAEMLADLRGGTFEWARYSLDDTLPALQHAFGDDTHVWCLRPARMVYQFACFQQFARVNLVGAASYDPSAARAGAGIERALELGLREAEADGTLPPSQGALPLVLLGFSKGVVVLNQLVAELGAEERAARALIARCSAIHFVDGGNGVEPGAFPSGVDALVALAREWPRLRIAVHSTPYMLSSPKSPWIGAERAAFVKALEDRGAAVRVCEYSMDQAPSLDLHFELLAQLQAG